MIRALLAVCALVVGLPAWALTVTSLADDGGPGTLRSVIAATAAGGTVDFAVSGSITLGAGQIAIAKNLVIAGPGAKLLSVAGGGTQRLFAIGAGANVAISGLTLSGGVATDGGAAPSGFGGAIATAGALTLDAVRLTGNTASQGGGALYLFNDGVASGSATIRSSTFDANAVVGSLGVGGGGILARGDAVLAQPAVLRLLNSTVSGNLANAAPAMSGGGIMFSAAQVTLVASTVAFNRGGATDAAVSGANLYQGSAAGTSLAIRNSVVGRGQVGGGAVANTALEVFLPGSASVASEGYSIVEHRPAGAGWLASDLAALPALDALADRGGPTPTHGLAAASPARDHVPAVKCVDLAGAALTTDQRGLARGPGSCASGAFEPQPALLLTPAPRTFTLQAGAPFSQAFTVTGGAPPYTLVVTGSVPGLSVSGLVLAGTPTTPGRYDISVQATDSASGFSAAQAYAFQVVRAPVTMTLGASSASVPAGTGVTLTATVTGSIAPSGTVAFRDGAANVPGCSAVALAGASVARTATCATGGLSMGSHTFTALYGGDAIHLPATATTVVAVAAVPGTECAGFADVDAANAFCANVDWLRNRGITQGCSTDSYCPDATVTRVAMAALLNRLGTALTPVSVLVDAASGALDPDASPVACASGPVDAATFPRRAKIDAVLMGTAAASGSFAASLVVSLDNGASWQPVSTLPAGVLAGRWTNLRLLGSLDIAAGQAVRFGLRVERGGSTDTADLADSRCVLRATVGNRNETFSPFDEPE